MNEILLYGTVGGQFWDEDYFTSKQVLDQIAGTSGDITVRINSGGGVATEGQAIYTALRMHPGAVHIVVDSMAASAASLIAMAGDTITMRDGAFLMIHDPASMWVDGRGTAEDHERMAKGLNVIGEAYAGIYAKRSGMTPEEARAIMREETFFGPADAVEAGFATHTEDEQAIAAAAFDYRIYQNAPEALVSASKHSGHAPDKLAAVAMIAGSPLTHKEAVMADNTKAGAGTPNKDPQTIAQAAPADAKVDAAAIVANERKRVSGILATARNLKLPESKAQEFIDSGATLADAQAALIDAFADAPEADKHEHRPVSRVTVDARDKFREGAALAVGAKVGLKDGERNEFSSLTLSELARKSLDLSGASANFGSRMDMVGAAFTMSGGHSTSDFASILENIANKSMMRGFDEQEETFEQWTTRGVLSDFKATKRVGLEAFPNLPKVAEGAEFTYGSMGDYGESVILATYGKLFSITRQAIINDDLSAFTSIPQKMGRAARRTVGDLAYGVLTANAAMSDGTALFHADHNNLASSGAAPSVTTMNDAATAMATQKGRAGSDVTALNIRPAYGLFPYALRGTALEVLESEHNPAKQSRAANTARNMVQPIFDARLDANSTAAWYLAASPMAGDTIEISYLDGVAAPFLDQQDGWSVDGVEFKVRIDAAATALDWAGLYKNAGA